MPVIGLEVHAQLLTRSKLFCGCSTRYHDSLPNTHTCEVCLGMPGALPVLNERALDFGLRVAEALNCDLIREQAFYRKNYFYPDLPKNFQITQYEFPVGKRGYIGIDSGENQKKVCIRRIHLEEDPGRLVHRKGKSLIDYNRSGVPLVEIVTEPDLGTPKEVRGFLRKLRTTLEYLEVFEPLDGAMRCDANVSIEEGARVEIKNISSHKGAEKALRYEISRQKNLLRRGKEAVMETRHFDEESGITRPMRTKEEEADYRYFLEPNLPLIKVSDKRIEKAVEEIPELPDAKKKRFMQQYGVSEEQANRLVSEKKLANFYEKVVETINPVLAASHIIDELIGELNYRERSLREWLEEIGSRKAVRWEKEILELLEKDEITDVSSTKVLRDVLDEKTPPKKVVKKKGLKKESIENAEQTVEKIIKREEKAVQDYLSGKKEAMNFLVGQVMKETKGKVSAKEASKMFKEKLEK